MCVMNDLDRFHLVGDVIDRVPKLGARAAYAKQAIRDKLIEHKEYIAPPRRGHAGDRGLDLGAAGGVGGRPLDRGRQRLSRERSMEGDKAAAGAMAPSGTPDLDGLLEQYGCGPVRFTGTEDALYERHLLFDNVVDPAAAGPRERYEAVARSVRDILSQRWVRTEQTYERENPKRVYYLSMEFLIGRSLANNIMNLRLDPLVEAGPSTRRASTGSRCSRRSPTPAWATAGSAASRRASSTRWRRCSSRPWATGCATSTASSGRRSRTAGSRSSRTTGCGGPTRGRSPGRRRRWRSSSAARSRCAAAASA